MSEPQSEYDVAIETIVSCAVYAVIGAALLLIGVGVLIGLAVSR